MPTDPDPSEMRAHYDFSADANPTQGKYLEKYRSGTKIVRIDPDLSTRFPDSDAVNAALRRLIELIPETNAPGD
jgi:hypothetical protein